ncbi:hypothetical protein C0J52_04399 [Blattella germanica]|nr:hypothetical protein C0J52_04399 [Blattella germanica]
MFQGSVLANSYWSDGVALIEYEKPEPAEDTGVHRLLYLIFEQEEPMVSLSSPGDRKFHLGNWLDENKEKICGPIVASEFTMIF